MPRIFSFWAISSLLLLDISGRGAIAADPADHYPSLNLVPWPKSVQVGEGRMNLSAESRIVAGAGELRPLAEVLSGEIAVLTDLKLKVVVGDAHPGDIVLRIDKAIRADESILAVRDRQVVRTAEVAHTVTIGNAAVVEGCNYQAVAEGSATVLQALGMVQGRVSLPHLTIKDWPHADFCAMMVDVGRQNHPIEMLKKMVEVCRFYKVRYLQLHLTDDQGWTFPSTKFPTLGSKNHGAHGGVAPKVYTLEELKQLVAFGDARGVTLVPEMEVPGHSGAALRSLPEVFDAIDPKTGQPVGMGCMNMSNEAIYPALDIIIGEMCDVFKSSPYFHIGSDEVSMGRVTLHSGFKAFMEKHHLKSDDELARHFIAQVNEIVKKHGRKAIKWEGLANEASKDIIVMCWDNNNNSAAPLIARGYSTITCPWGLGVPWEEWNMYICNGSRLKKGDSVLGSVLVAWEQPPEIHLLGVRSVASRQERTWGPDNRVTEQGFASRFQALDAAVGKLVDRPARLKMPATFSASAGTSDFLDPVFAFDGKDATFYKSGKAPAAGDHFTLVLEGPKSVYGIEALTGSNGKGMLDGGELQVSADGMAFKTVAVLRGGSAKAILDENRIRAVRLLAKTQQTEPLVVREIKLQLLVETSGTVTDPATTIGEGNVAVLKGDTTFAYPINDCQVPVTNKGFTLTLHSGGGNACSYGGPIGGMGKVEIHMGGRDGGFRNSPFVLIGKSSNSFQGTWYVKTGRLVLAKEAGAQALGGTIVVGGQGDNDCICWNGSDQIEDSASIRLLDSPKGAAHLNLNGFGETIGSLTMDSHTKILTDGPAGAGVLAVGKLEVEGKRIPDGVWTASSFKWIQGSGYVLVGESKRIDVSGTIDDPVKSIGFQNIAVLRDAATVKLAQGHCAVPFDTRAFPLTLVSQGAPARSDGFIAGRGMVQIDAAGSGSGHREPLELGGNAANSYKGPTILTRGVLKLNKSSGAIAIPGNLTLGGSTPENAGDGVIWGADGQLSTSSVVTLQGDRPCFLDLAGHKAVAARLSLSSAAAIQTGVGGELKVNQLHIDGKRMADGKFTGPLPWLKGTGSVTVDARVDVAGRTGDCNAAIGPGNIANLTGNFDILYPVSDCSNDIITNGHRVTFDSGDGNAMCCNGTISGTGDVVLLMGPSYTGFKDAPLRIAGTKPNTTTGTFYVRKGRVQLEKTEGIDAISGNVVVGGQGFNDCLFWANSNQIKDSASITLIGAGKNGAGYLHLNGCSERVASLTMIAGSIVKTDSAKGVGGVLTLKSLTVDGIKKAAGTYTSTTEKWIEGKGKVVVGP